MLKVSPLGTCKRDRARSSCMNGLGRFEAAPSVSFTVGDEEKGVQKKYGPLMFLKVHDAGHMVPMDQPKAALEMLQRWTHGNL
ncbi:hypothetical protein RDI58_000891 [Solanum bulbocastanum]|uniref:Uncharacterized protein n=1 Tax=Solanum bulbocastanum TaxID=147425 RepID=A0AAN8U1Y9_SOLBU